MVDISTIDVPFDDPEDPDPVRMPALNVGFKEPRVNAISSFLPLKVITQDITSGTLDLTDLKCEKHSCVVVNSNLVSINALFVEIQQSVDGHGAWKTLRVFPKITASGVRFQNFTRDYRFLRAVVKLEFPASPSAPTLELAILLIT